MSAPNRGAPREEPKRAVPVYFSRDLGDFRLHDLRREGKEDPHMGGAHVHIGLFEVEG